jgi:hypothetical protein
LFKELLNEQWRSYNMGYRLEEEEEKGTQLLHKGDSHPADIF